MQRLQYIHLVTGLIFLVFFLLTGGYLYSNFPEIYEKNETMRFMYCSNHIYILMAGLMNLGLGSYIRHLESPKLKMAQYFGSGLIVISPAILLLAFFIEPIEMSVDRPITFLGILTLLVGIVIHSFSSIFARREIQSIVQL